MNPRIRFVLVRTEEAGNAGAAARVLANFGFRDLVLVSPALARPEEGRKWARGAEEILDGARRVDRLEDALEDCVAAFATTRRLGRLRGTYASPREAAGRAAEEAAGGPVAWVFGPESRGLETAEVALCHTRVTIPTTPEHPSLNLAQAVAICAYETRLALAPTPRRTRRRAAALGAREALYTHLQEALQSLGFLPPGTERTRMLQLRGILERAAPSPDEVRFLRGIARQALWATAPGRNPDGGLPLKTPPEDGDNRE